jgi:hypothetical protein
MGGRGFKWASCDMSNDRFWLYEWIDNVGIQSYSQAERFLKDPVVVADLRERAASEPYTTEQLPTSDDEGTILAGRAIEIYPEAWIVSVGNAFKKT